MTVLLGLRLRFDRRRRADRQDQAGLEPAEDLQTGIQALQRGVGEPKETHHQVARSAGKNLQYKVAYPTNVSDLQKIKLLF